MVSSDYNALYWLYSLEAEQAAAGILRNSEAAHHERSETDCIPADCLVNDRNQSPHEQGCHLQTESDTQ